MSLALARSLKTSPAGEPDDSSAACSDIGILTATSTTIQLRSRLNHGRLWKRFIDDISGERRRSMKLGMPTYHRTDAVGSERF